MVVNSTCASQPGPCDCGAVMDSQSPVKLALHPTPKNPRTSKSHSQSHDAPHHCCVQASDGQLPSPVKPLAHCYARNVPMDRLGGVLLSQLTVSDHVRLAPLRQDKERAEEDATHVSCSCIASQPGSNKSTAAGCEVSWTTSSYVSFSCWQSVVCSAVGGRGMCHMHDVAM